VGLGLAVVVAVAVRHADRRHARDSGVPTAQRGQHVPEAAVVDALRSGLAATVGAMPEDDGLDAIDGGAERLWMRQIGDDSPTSSSFASRHQLAAVND